MKRLTLKDVGIALMLFAYLSLIALGLMSCSVRKTQTKISKEESKVSIIDNSTIDKKSESNVKETKVVTVDDKNETVTEETTYEPEDPLKESFLIEKDGTKTVFNNLKKTFKKTTQKNNTKSESNAKSEITQKEAVKEVKKIKLDSDTEKYNKSKLTDKKAYSWYNWLWLLIPIGVIIWLFRKYKDKIWWI